MKQTTTYTYARAKSAIAITAIACVVLSHVAGPLAVVPTVEAASSFRPTIFVNTEAFLVIDDDDTTADVVMRFGDTLAKTLTFNRAFDRFEFNDDVYVTGTIQASNTLSGAIVHAQSQLRASGSLVVDGTVIVNNNTINVYRNASAALSLFSDGTTATIQSFSQPMALNPSGNNVGIGKADPRTKLDVVGAISGSFVYATKSFSGAGLTDCDTAGTSKLLWDATTGRFSCGTDQGSAYTAGQGLNLSTTSFRLNTTVTGAVLQAGNVLASSGSLSWKGAGSGKSIAVMQDSYFLGNLGIGTDTPSAKLHATGNIRTDSDLYVLGSDIYSNGILAARSQDEAFIMLDYDNNGSTERFRIAKNSGGDPADVDTLFTIVESGNTGIGTVSPKAKLDVVGIMSGVTLYATKSFSGAGLSDCDTAGTSKLLWDATAGRFSCGTDTDTNTTYTAGQGLNLSASNAFSLKTTVTGAVIQATNSLASSGALTWKGIGSGGRLDVGGGTIQIAANGSAVFNENSQNLDYRFEGDGNANLLFLDASSDRVGIGTATPNYNVEIHGGASFSYISLINNASGLSANDGFQFGLESDASAAYILMRENGPLHFRTNNTNKMSILANGNVGIGTTAPRTKLDVVGAISGSFIYATQSFSGAGLSDCDTAGTSKLLWDATTGRFSCGTDSGAAYTAGQGLSLNGTSFRVNDTLTGSLARFSTVSGSTIFAKDTLASSGSIILKSATGNADMFVTSTVAHANGYFDAATGNNAAIRLRENSSTKWSLLTQGTTDNFIIAGDGGMAVDDFVTITQDGNVGIGPGSSMSPKAKLAVAGTISGTTLYAIQSFSGAGLTDCDDGTNSKLLWDATTGRFSCGTDQTSGDDWGAGTFSIYDGSTSQTINQSDTITFADGTNIDVAVSGTDTVTIGINNAYLNDVNQYLNTSAAPSFDSVTANYATVNTTLNVTGNTVLGSDNSDNVTFYGDVNSAINPDSNNSYDFGNSSYWWNESWIYQMNSVGLTTSNVTITGITSCNGGSVLATDSSGSVYCDTDDTSAYYFNISDGTNTQSINNAELITFLDGTNINVSVDSMTDNVTIALDNAYLNDVNQYLNTSSSVTFGTLNVSGDLNSVVGTAYLSGNVNLGDTNGDSIAFNGLANTSITPYSNNTYDIGNTSNRWATGYFNALNVSDSGFFGGNLSTEATFHLNPDNSDSYIEMRFGGSDRTRSFAYDNVIDDFTLGDSLYASGSLLATGTLSGASLYGLGLVDCDDGTNSKLLWDATTGRFSCGTDQAGGGTGGGAWSNTGSLTLAFDDRYVNVAGDTMTGALAVQSGNAAAATLATLLNVRGTMSGKSLTVMGTGATALLSTTTGKPTVRIGGSGSLVIENRSSDPGSSPDNTASLFARKIGGRSMLHQGSGSTFAASPLQNALFGNLIMALQPGGGTTVNGIGTTVTNDTTVSHPAAGETFGYMTNFATAATANDEAGTSSANVAFFRGSTGGANGFFYYARVGVVDTTSITVFSGMADQTIATMVGADNPTGNHAGFQFSTGRGDTNWQFETRDGTTQNVVNTGLAFTANKVYDLTFTCTKQCAAITWEIRNVTDGTSATGTTSSNLPTVSAALRIILGVETETTAARNIRMQQVYVEADR